MKLSKKRLPQVISLFPIPYGNRTKEYAKHDRNSGNPKRNRRTVNYYIFLFPISGVSSSALRLLRKIEEYICCVSRGCPNHKNYLYKKRDFGIILNLNVEDDREPSSLTALVIM